ncbi:mannose-6-phosphate isomerase, class I [Kocuria tytonicola]|uniref:mannose-6-phosphate isomerase n=2 Tax=Kocuria tytonicola TaxID=2055946 RepID=A0A3L9L668_9MICC|nr:mannose-6-phosphate isomerase, class I [Kocuria tytonicola]RLZ02951.1 mannose-6-phosphate isomerase, class I [Kocuria tytonicola]
MCAMAEFLRMSNPIQHYAWGSRSVLAGLQGRPCPTERPEAELWMGAHASAPSRVELDGRQCGLDEVAPHLPFLLKILAIEAPLSIQVHPTSDQAREGFARENAAGTAPDAPHRNYKDEHAKPETVVALTDMWLLAGQRDREALAVLAAELDLPWLARAAASPSPLRHALELSDDDAAAAVRACATAAGPSSQEGTVSLTPGLEPAELTRRLIRLLGHHYPQDRGLLVAVCMNVVHLAPGQALFTPAQQVHAYLSGTAVEVMGCSDNVLRAGLTSKHVDVPELLAVMAQEQQPVTLLETLPTPDGAVRYPLWDPAISLVRATVAPGRPLVRETAGTCMLLVTEGSVTARAGCSGRGGAAECTASSGESLVCLDGPSTVTVEGTGQVFLVEAVTPRRP